MIDIKAIKAAAEAATPGKWEDAGPSFGDPLPRYLNCVGYLDEDGVFLDICDQHDEGEGTANMNFIATANPATVIALCDEVERLRGELRRSESLIEQYREEAAHRENPDDYVMQY